MFPLGSEMTQTTFFESLLKSPTPEPISLVEFNNEAHKLPAIFEAPVRHVSCYRNDIHEYILVHCSVTLPSTLRPVIAYFRLERNPAVKSIPLLSGKTIPASDTIRLNIKLESLRQNESSAAVRGYFIFNAEDNAPKPIMLKHILEIYDYLAQASNGYRLLGTNCRWFCYGFLECLRDCKPCFGGQWFSCSRKDVIPKQDIQTAVRAKNHYLKEKHSGCCHQRARASSIMSALVAEATNIGAAATNMAEIVNQAQNTQPTMLHSEPNVIYSTTGPTTPPSQSTLPPRSDVHCMPNNAASPQFESGLPAVVNESEMSYSPGTARLQHQHRPAHTHRQSGSYDSLYGAPSSQPTYDSHIPHQPFRADTTARRGYGGPPHEGYPFNPQVQDGEHTRCACSKCISYVTRHMYRSSVALDHSYSPQVPLDYRYNSPLPSHHVGGFRPPPHPHQRQPAPPPATTLYNIPEGTASERHDYRQHTHRTSAFEQPPPNCSNCGHHPTPSGAPAPRRTSVHNRGPSGHAYTQDFNNGYTGPGYTDNTGPQTVHSNMRPREPMPTQWFSQDSANGAPPRTESPSQMSTISQDEGELNYTHQYLGPNRQMTMPDPDNYRHSTSLL